MSKNEKYTVKEFSKNFMKEFRILFPDYQSEWRKNNYNKFNSAQKKGGKYE